MIQPVEFQKANDIIAVQDAIGAECELLEAARADFMMQMFAQFAVGTLPQFERTFGIAVAATDTTLQRQARVLAYFLRATLSGSGLDWAAQINLLIGGGWSYATHNPADGASPAARHVRITLPDASGSPQAIAKQVLINMFTSASLVIDWIFGNTALYDRHNFDDTGKTLA